MYEYPPILTGSEQQQLLVLRDYLVRLAKSLDTAEKAQISSAAQESGRDNPLLSDQNGRTTREQEEKLAALRRNAANLRALIVKTAGEAETLALELGVLRQDMESRYLAKSDFGTYMEQVKTSFTATARGVVESYDFASLIEAVNDRADALDLFMTAIRGEIRRGLITDPGTGETVMGIAIAENLQFTGQVHEEDGLQYYELAPGQTLGLYTATGWQFWVNGSKRGWFDSRDGRLHVISEVVEDGLQLGADWAVSNAGGFGIKYVGA
jgi:hypothetical protein